MTVAELLVAALEAEGVQYVFGVPGEENEALLFALEKSKVRFVATRHEQGAAFMADVWGRLSGKAGVCLSTLGPGATNLLSGIADAYLDKAPLVAVTAQGSQARLYRESHQILDVMNLLDGVTKWNASIATPASAAALVRKAFKLAQEEKPGAVHLELPENMASQEVESADEKPITPRPAARPGPNAEALVAAEACLETARKPLILAGNGALRQGASPALRALVEHLDLPVVSTFMGKGALSDASPRSLYSIGLGFRDLPMAAVDEADLLLAVGYDIVEMPPERWNPQADKRIIHIDYLSAEVYRRYQPEVELVGDVAATLAALQERIPQRQRPSATPWWLRHRQAFEADLREDRLPDDAQWSATDQMTVPGALAELRALLPDDAIVISDVGSHKMWIARNFPTFTANSCLISNGFATMGIALPGAVAASLQAPEKTVVACMGDGGALMNFQELETATRLGCHFIAIIFNDNDYGLIRWKQQQSVGASTGTSIGNPDFVQLAKAFGAIATRADSPGKLRAAVEAAKENREGVHVIEVPVDASVNKALVRRLEHKMRAVSPAEQDPRSDQSPQETIR
ncbi:MAG: acetolactate synthase large subunit [Polyangiales bacterium]